MTVPHTSPFARSRSPRRLLGLMALAASLFATACVAASPDAPVTAPVPATVPDIQLAAAAAPADPPPTGSKETLVGGLPLFANWPKDKKPDAVVVLSGQTFGFLQPCGCSRPQIGGLERRAVLIDSLRAKGWPTAGVDLGDIHPEKSALQEQGRLKYVATMNALREMGYLGIGLGKTELANNPIALLGSYAYQKEQRPFTLAANAVGLSDGKPIPREQYFNAGKEGARPVVELIEVGKFDTVAVGVAGVVGKVLQEENQKEKWGEKALDFPNAKQALADAVKALAKHPAKPTLNVLVFQGPSGDAAKAAADFPQFRIVLCQSDSDLPPLQPQTIAHKDGTKTFVVQVGHRGQHVGVVGAFKQANGTFDLKYQLVPLGEEYVTPGTEAEALKANKVLQALEDYAVEVKKADLLAKYPRVPHEAQIRAQGLNPAVKLSYVGSEACRACHAAEYKKWAEVPHGHAMETLEKVAKRPSLRQFDGECVRCHSVGFDHPTGYVDEKTTKHLRHVGCESCHGPGSGHVGAPKNKDFLAYMSPWKQDGAAKLPDPAFMKKVADTPAPERGKIAVAPATQLLIRGVENRCMKCHDHDADPHFDLYKQWAKIDHSGLAPKGGWPEKAP